MWYNKVALFFRSQEKIDRSMPVLLDSLAAIKTAPGRTLAQRYDVFISYAHADTDCAQAFLQMFEDINPSLNVFYDRKELKAGTILLRSKDILFASESSGPNGLLLGIVRTVPWELVRVGSSIGP